MYRRSRPGRERSRDPSRPFPQGRDRDYDARYRREDHHPSGHWDDRGEERRRDERPLPASLPPIPPPPAAPPTGPPGHLPELSNFARDPSKGPNVRRESRDSARDPLPVDAARRHSGGSSSLSLRNKEFSEPSPRERGMIGDPPALSSRRQISNSSWPRDRDDDRDRIDTVRSRKNSLERNPDNLPRSPITESPRSLLPPASPATSISAATPTAPSMAPAALPGFVLGPEKNQLARVFQEASYAYVKYLDAQNNWKVADKERSDHIEHFNTFPVLKERYEGTARLAKKELQSATEILGKRSLALDQLCSGLINERLSKREAESAVEFCDKIKKELGNSTSLAQFIKANPPPLPPQVPAPSKDEFQQLRDEFRDLRRKQQDEEKARQTLAKEFQSYKNEHANRLQTQDAKLTGFQMAQSELRADIERVKVESRETTDELRKILAVMKISVSKLEASKNDVDIVMADTVNEGALDEVRKTLEELHKIVIGDQKKLLETNTKCGDISATIAQVKGETENLQQKVSTLEDSVILRNTEPTATLTDGPNGAPHRDCATKADIEQLVINIKNQDELLDTFRSGAEKDTSDILEEIQGLDQKMETHVQTTNQKIHDLNVGIETHTQTTTQMIHDFGQKTTNQVTGLITEQEIFHTRNQTKFKEIEENLGRQFINLSTKFQNDFEGLRHKVAFVENHLEGHVLAITHQEQRMNSFTTKDFYERVVANLIQINPLLFNYTNQLQICNNEIKAVRDTVQVLSNHFNLAGRRIPTGTPSSRPAILDVSLIDPSANGNAPSSELVITMVKDMELQGDQIQKLDDRVTDHIETYVAKMRDIKEWTVSCTLRLADNTASVAALVEDLAKVKEYIDIQEGHQGPHMTTAASGIDRWRAVSNNQEQMQGLSDETG